MKELSITQEFFLCSLNKKGKLPIFGNEVLVCILAGGLIELMIKKCIKIDEKNAVSAMGNLDKNLTYLKSLFEWISESKQIKIEKIAQEYVLSFVGKRLNLLKNEIGTSLVEAGFVTIKKGGIFGNKTYFVPNQDEVDKIVQKIRAELLEEGKVSDETVALVSLLQKSHQIKKYFSKYESEKLETRLKEIKETQSNKLVKRMVDYIDEMVAVFAAVLSTIH